MRLSSHPERNFQQDASGQPQLGGDRRRGQTQVARVLAKCLVVLALLVLSTWTARGANANKPAFPAQHLADYDAEPRRSDGRVDLESLAARLKELGVTTYYWLIWHAPSDWDDLKSFLPKAAEAGIQVWVYLVPPSEPPPSEPFKADFDRWAEEIARLSLQHTNLTAWVIDDFYANHAVLTPKAIRAAEAKAKGVNSGLLFLPLMYFDEVTPQFVQEYRTVIDGVVVAYLQDREQLEHVWSVLNDAPIPPASEMSFPWDTPSAAGDFVMASTSGSVGSGNSSTVTFRERDNFNGPTSGYHFKQLLVDGTVAWEEDVAGGSADWREISVDLTNTLRGRTNLTLAFRLLDKRGVSNFGVRWELSALKLQNIQPASRLAEPQQWQVSRQGAFDTGFGRPPSPGARRFHVPFISMTAANPGEFQLRHGAPATPERIAEKLSLSLKAWQEGKCDGVVTYCLDKGPDSLSFALVEKLFRQAKEQKR